MPEFVRDHDRSSDLLGQSNRSKKTAESEATPDRSGESIDG
jgi:hypothetical protein